MLKDSFVMLEISYIKCVKFIVDIKLVPSGCISSSWVSYFFGGNVAFCHIGNGKRISMWSGFLFHLSPTKLNYH